MKPLTREWAEKAEGDYATARRELRARREPNYDAACFHARQCVEIYLKALAKPLLASQAVLQGLVLDFRTLTAYAVETRYPGKASGRDRQNAAIIGANCQAQEQRDACRP